jgi:transcription antitermination factor NusG
MSSPWFALRVRPRHEKTAAIGLERQGFETYLPLQRVRRRWSDRVKEIEEVLFSPYIFCRIPREHRLRVLNSPSVESIVGFGKIDVPVADEEIEAIRALLASGRPLVPWPYLKMGQRVRITEGALAGIEGTLVRDSSALRVVISVNALERSIAIQLDREAVIPIAA